MATSADATMQRLRPIAVLAAVLAVGPGPAEAQLAPRADADTPGIEVEAAAGFDGTVDRSHPIPVSLLIRNDTGQLIEGEVILTDPGNGFEHSLGEVYLAPGATRRVSSIQAMVDWFECYASLQSEGRVLWRRELPLATGREFFANTNFVLFVDDGGRALQLPGAEVDTTAGTPTAGLADEDGRPFRCLNVKSWQMPHHPGPLVQAQAIVLRDEAPVDLLDRVQWEAIGEWVCQGGLLFVHRDSGEIVEKLLEHAPLVATAPRTSGLFEVRELGLGRIHQYDAPLFAENTETAGQISEIVAQRSGYHLTSVVDTGNLENRRGGRADMNRALVLSFFGFYTLCSGFGSLLLFRQSRRRVGLYTLIVVGGACLVAAVLGGVMRLSQGDLRWLTITQAGPGGLVQVGRINLYSAGGRNTEVGITGNRADLQFIGRSRQYYYYWQDDEHGYPPFTWQPNLAGTEDACRIRVPVTPWGSCALHATGYLPQQTPLDFQLSFTPQPPADVEPMSPAEESMSRGDGSMSVPDGRFSLQLVNRLPWDLTDCWVIVATTRDNPDVTTAPPVSFVYGPGGQLMATTSNGTTDVYHMESIPRVAAGETLSHEFPARFRVMEYRWDRARSWHDGSITPPRVDQLGAASAWIIGQLKRSPILAIDQQNSDFVPQEELHLFIQEIRPEHMPDPALFRTPETSDENAPDNEASQDGATQDGAPDDGTNASPSN